MKKLLCSLALPVLLLLASCKKDDPATPGVSLVAKWQLESSNYIEYDNGVNVYQDMYNGLPRDYIDFRSNDKMYSYVMGYYDTTSYQILANGKVNIDGDLFDIKTLTSSNTELYNKTINSATNYDEVTIKLKK